VPISTVRQGLASLVVQILASERRTQGTAFVVCGCAVSHNNLACIGLATWRCADTFPSTAYRRSCWTPIVNLIARSKSGSAVHQVLGEACNFSLFRADVVCWRSAFVHPLEQVVWTEAGCAIFQAATGLVTVVRGINGTSSGSSVEAVSGLLSTLACWAHIRDKRGAFLSKLGASTWWCSASTIVTSHCFIQASVWRARVKGYALVHWASAGAITARNRNIKAISCGHLLAMQNTFYSVRWCWTLIKC